jgi:RNA polymerase sigma-70 factor, ECF subfamily
MRRSLPSVEVAIIPSSDHQLVEEIRSGSREAFAEIYARHKDSVYNYCVRLTKDPESAKDAMQEAFLRMHSGLSRLRNGTVLRVWLLSIARNFVLNSLRNKQLVDRLDHEPLSTDESPFEVVLRKEESQTVRFLIESLHPALREVIVLREYEGLSYRDIASVTGISEENVKVRIYRARKAIAAGLKKQL